MSSLQLSPLRKQTAEQVNLRCSFRPIHFSLSSKINKTCALIGIYLTFHLPPLVGPLFSFPPVEMGEEKRRKKTPNPVKVAHTSLIVFPLFFPADCLRFASWGCLSFSGPFFPLRCCHPQTGWNGYKHIAWDQLKGFMCESGIFAFDVFLGFRKLSRAKKNRPEQTHSMSWDFWADKLFFWWRSRIESIASQWLM